MANCARITMTLAAALGLAGIALAQTPEREMSCDNGWSNNDRATHCEINETTIAAVPRLTVDGGVNGGITVKGWTGGQVLVRARVDTTAETDGEARDTARQIVIHTAGGRVVADGPEQSGRRNWSVSYEIFVPQKTGLNLKAHNGGIRISDVQGDIEFETVNGGVSLRRLAGNVRGHATNGGLNVELAGSRWEDGELDASTVNGGVRVSVPDNYSAHLETGTVNGHISVDFPVTVNGEIGKRLSIDLGSGGPRVRAVTTNGGVKIERKTS